MQRSPALGVVTFCAKRKLSMPKVKCGQCWEGAEEVLDLGGCSECKGAFGTGPVRGRAEPTAVRAMITASMGSLELRAADRQHLKLPDRARAT